MASVPTTNKWTIGQAVFLFATDWNNTVTFINPTIVIDDMFSCLCML